MGNLGESLTQEEIQVYLGTSLKLSTPTFQQHRQPENLIILGEGLIKEEIQVYLWNQHQPENLSILWEGLTQEEIQVY